MTSTRKRRPNVVLIVADDMGYGDFGIFSEGRVSTPELDRMVAEGVCFRQHYSGSPICSPARAALLTGRYPHRTGAINQFELMGLDRIALREKTLADFFHRAGYRTGLVGKWHNGALDARFEPIARGFDEFAGFCGGWSDYYRWTLQRNETLVEGDGRYLTDVLTQEACGFIDRAKDHPFLLMLAYSAPHSPFQAPQPTIDRYLAAGHDRITATTYAMIEEMDAKGSDSVLERLSRHGLEDDTIVLFTSDNGPAFFNPPFMLEPDDEPFNPRFNAGLRGSKGWVYEGGIRVPMVVRYPAALPGRDDARRPRPFHRLAPDPRRPVRGRPRRRVLVSMGTTSRRNCSARRPRSSRAGSGSGTSTIRTSRPTRPSAMATGSSSGRSSRARDTTRTAIFSCPTAMLRWWTASSRPT